MKVDDVGFKWPTDGESGRSLVPKRSKVNRPEIVKSGQSKLWTLEK